MFKRSIAKLAAFLLAHVELEAPERDRLFVCVVDLLKQKSFSNEERQMLTATFLDRLGSLPLHATIMVDNAGGVVVNGRSLNLERATQLKQAAVAMQRNAARNLVRETVTFLAIKDGVHKNINPEMGLFAKGALWFLQQEDELYALLAEGGSDDDE